ncbi:universal stress protein [Bosea rubneri]|uniref:Universal stress protein n=1 Tax=Bosea rubneri TaxID=3075434 RepID=A0ABU3SAG7_9HYPH|nr:universal stress protein [Bosea sp. ZW T0_25]MDU0341782.1 universal stress protein [Bosea sp. ZW T0_25]
MAHDFRKVLIGLVPADESGGATAAVRFGVGLARHFGAALTFQAIVPHVTLPYSVVGGFAAGMVAEENKRRRELVEAAAAAARALADEAGLACVADLPDLALEELAERFIQQARLQDVTVLDAGDDLLGNNRSMIEEALFNSGRPLIVIPKTGGNPAPKRIAVAWDGSARSARAVGDALPLLAAAQSVSVVVIGGEKDLSRVAPASGLIGYLEHHGVKSDLVALEAVGGDVAETLRRHVLDSAVELVIMGAFVHSRFRQAVLGGTTRSLLENSPVPLFLAY